MNLPLLIYIYAYIYMYHIHTPSRIAKLVFPLMLLFDLQRRKISGGQRQLLRENRPFKGHAAVENGADLQRVNPTIERFMLFLTLEVPKIVVSKFSQTSS